MNTVLVTGGTGSIGRELVRRCLKDGYRVIYTSRAGVRHDVFKDLSDAYDNDKLRAVASSFATPTDISDLVAVLSQEDSLYGLVHSARSIDALAVQEDGTTSAEHLMQEYFIDVVVPYRLSVELAELHALKRIVLVGSIYGTHPFNPTLYGEKLASAPIQYSLAKAALQQLHKELAIRLGNQNVAVNTINYGGVAGRVDQQFAQRYAEQCAGPGMLQPAQVAGPVSFLLSEDATGITGTELSQDNGYSLW